MLNLLRVKSIYMSLLDSYSNPNFLDEKAITVLLHEAETIELNIDCFIAIAYLIAGIKKDAIFANYENAIISILVESYLASEGYEVTIPHLELYDLFDKLEAKNITPEFFANFLRINSTKRTSHAP